MQKNQSDPYILSIHVYSGGETHGVARLQLAELVHSGNTGGQTAPHQQRLEQRDRVGV